MVCNIKFIIIEREKMDNNRNVFDGQNYGTPTYGVPNYGVSNYAMPNYGLENINIQNF